MASLRYLNFVLTVIAVLLGMHLWTSWSVPTAAPAYAAPQEAPSGGGIPNAGAQRQQQVDMLKRLSQQTDELIGLFRSGQARVRVDAPRAAQ